MKTDKFIFGFLALSCVCFVTCSNPIMEKWWAETERGTGSTTEENPDTQRPEEPREPVLPGGPDGPWTGIEIIEVIRDIRLLYINYIIFAPDSIGYNQPSHPGGVDLTQQRKDLNNTIIGEVKHIVDAIDTTQSTIKILVNGYSNPSIPQTDPNWENEVTDCQWVSNARAEEVTGELVFVGVDFHLITYSGYGGTQTVVTYNPGNLASAELNRRVEIIIIEVVQ